MMSSPICLESYCGVESAAITNISFCAACQWGYRPDATSICQRCISPVPVYDWMYLGFMLLLSLILHGIAIDIHTNKKSRQMLFLHLSVVLETVTAALCSLLLLPPMGSLDLFSCGVQSIRDWYPVFFKPIIHQTTFYCTQEMVFPLYTIVMIFYGLQLPAMLIFRPIFSSRLVSKQGVDTCKPVYTALYFLPLLTLVHAVVAGILYYCYAYLMLTVSSISLAVHISQYREQNWCDLLRHTMLKGRSLGILLLHWFLHAFGILALIDTSDSVLAGCLMLLVPLPYLLYVFSERHTNPDRLDRILASSSTN